MTLGQSLFRFLVFPGLVFAVPAGWFLVWLERKLTARMQNRIGPPFLQPFYDFVKLLGKQPLTAQSHGLTFWLPVISSLALIAALGLLPVLTTTGGFPGDLVLLVTLLEVPMICIVLAGYLSTSVFGEVGATREAVLSLAYNIPFLAGIGLLATLAGSFNLAEIAAKAGALTFFLSWLAIFLSYPAKLHINPFSLTNAEQEIYTGPTTEYSGQTLALWELSHTLEWTALTAFLAAVFIPKTGILWLDILLFLLAMLLFGILLSVISAASARLKMKETTRIFWRAGLGLAFVSIAVLVLF